MTKKLDDLLIKAVEAGIVDLVSKCLEHDADVHARKDYALRWAAGNGHIEVVKVLKQHIERKRK